MMSLSSGERAFLTDVVSRLEKLINLMSKKAVPTEPNEILEYLLEIKSVLGNSNNSISFFTSLLAKEYLLKNYPGFDFDASKKAQGANGLDIDEMFNQKRIVGEIKATSPYKKNDFGAAQKREILKDLNRLSNTEAQIKYFFVLEDRTFDFLSTKYSNYFREIKLVALQSGREYVL